MRLARNCGVIREEEEAVYQYAFESLAGHICSFVTMFIIAFLCGIPQYILLYILLMYPLRTYSGGFHASTPGKCYVISTAMFVGMIACEGWISRYLSMGILTAVLLLCSAVVFVMAPAESANKPLNEKETGRYRTISRLLMAAEMVLILTMHILQLPSKSIYYAVSAPVIVTLLLALHYIEKLFHSIEDRQKDQRTEN